MKNNFVTRFVFSESLSSSKPFEYTPKYRWRIRFLFILFIHHSWKAYFVRSSAIVKKIDFVRSQNYRSFSNLFRLFSQWTIVVHSSWISFINDIFFSRKKSFVHKGDVHVKPLISLFFPPDMFWYVFIWIINIYE